MAAEALRAAPPHDGLSEKNFCRLAELIHSYSGIKMPPAKRTMLEGRLRRRVRLTGAASLDDYCRRLFDDDGLAAELVDLMDVVTTNKTEFFREPAHFDFLRGRGLAMLMTPDRPKLKAWSAACSIGAEPYTLAMVIEEHLAQVRSRAEYSILCTDLCTEVLGEAIAGVYSTAMIEPVPMELRRKYLMRARDRDRPVVRIRPELRARLFFSRLNLMDDAYAFDDDMDMIFCRNILIYFDKATQSRVLHKLCSLLRPGGLLFLGHSESVVGIDLPVKQIASTVFQRG
jgi:chemotaxis protein methyltransferase CheR